MSPFRFLCPGAALLGLSLSAAAQTAPAPADTARAYKHQLGLTASPVLDGFFRNNRSLPLGLLYQRQLTPTKALRLRLVGQYSRRDTTNYWSLVPTSTLVGYIEGPNTTAWDLNAYAGLECRKPLSRKFNYAYGAELGIGWSRVHSDYLLQVADPSQVPLIVVTGNTTLNIWRAQARPFLALQYRVANKVLLFAESAVLLTYMHRQQDAANHQVYYNGTGDGGRSNTSHSLSVVWRPIQLVGAAISF